MPRYCAVKGCRNRGGTASRQNDKRISFYPFPIQDKPRLQKWVDNMKREEWTPSRHQYLCSEHFTEDCFDIRWGIRYLKNRAIPTIFPAADDGGEKTLTTCKRSPKPKASTETDTEPKGFDSHASEMPLILRTVTKTPQLIAENGIVTEHSVIAFELPLAPEIGITCQTDLPDIQNSVCEIAGDSGIPAASRLACNKPHSEEQAESTVAMLCCETLGPFTDGEANVDVAALQATLSQAFHLVPVEMVKEKLTGCFLEESEPNYGENISVHEHSYCRPDTDREQLWDRILGLHAKILELDRREERTVTKIQNLENEIALLKRDSAIFKEKQKVLEDSISSVLL